MFRGMHGSLSHSPETKMLFVLLLWRTLANAITYHSLEKWEQSMRPESQAPFMILTGRNEDLKRTNNQRQTQFPGILVRGVGVCGFDWR